MKNNHLDFILEPIDKNRLAYLIGPEDENLVQIQKRLGVTIAYSGSHFHIEGEHKACKDAEYIIKNLYVETAPIGKSNKGSNPFPIARYISTQDTAIIISCP